MRELETLTQEPPGGRNYGRMAPAGTQTDGRRLSLDASEVPALEFAEAGGCSIVDTARGSGGATPGARDAGMSAHRGVLHPAEHVDVYILQTLVERELGFTRAHIRTVYRQGPLSAYQRELRGRIDARLLALSRSGTNIALLGRVLGFPIKANGTCRALENALARARAKEENG